MSLSFWDSSAESSAIDVLRENGFVELDCGEWAHEDDAILTADGEWVHTSDDSLYHCDYCDEWYCNEDSIYCEDNGNTYCSCDCAESDDLFCHDDGSWHDEPESGIGGYHNHPRTIHPASSEHPYRIGIEVEKVCQEVYEDFESFTMADGWIAEEDSSLNGGGFELVSPAYNLTQDDIDKDLDSMEALLNCDSDLSCGGHITISKLGTSGEGFAEQCKPLMVLCMALFPKRLRSSYVRSGKLDKLKKSSEKYCPFRISTTCIEFRIFSRVTSKACLSRRIKLIKHMLTTDDCDTVDKLIRSMEGGALGSMFSEVYNETQWEEKIELVKSFASWFDDNELEPTANLKPFLTCPV